MSVTPCANISPYTLIGLLLRLLRDHFASPSNIEDAALKQYAWVPKPGHPNLVDAAKSNIFIDLLHFFRLEHAGGRPAIVVGRGPVGRARKVLNNQAQGLIGEDADLPLAGYRKVEWWTMPLRVMAISPTPEVAERLVWEVQSRLEVGLPVLMQEYPALFKLEIGQVGELSRVAEDTAKFVVSLDVEAEYQTLYTVAQDAPRLRGVSLTVR